MKRTLFRITVKEFSALPFHDIQIKTAPSPEPLASRPRPAPENVGDFNVRSDGPVNAGSAREPGRQTLRELSAASDAAKSARVLIVDDERNIRESLAKVLRAEGYDVRTAENGEQALANYEPDQTDLVLLDLNMPVKHGWDALDQILGLNPQLL